MGYGFSSGGESSRFANLGWLLHCLLLARCQELIRLGRLACSEGTGWMVPYWGTAMEGKQYLGYDVIDRQGNEAVGADCPRRDYDLQRYQETTSFQGKGHLFQVLT